jgi:hypothetical protein
LRTLGIVGVDQAITATEMKLYDSIFATPIPLPVLSAMAALVDRELPADLNVPPLVAPAAGRPLVA